ncbi:hypothetical protein [Solicola gregarius]|uniref:Uncharacterized protein n=1 Tax=Solicola gregarius TaxID=2908642 RepID=A0AA46YJ92_9ACTN|nr:hypothetical protein [Solicola gregarius]UYM04077.1 hypothetical protein L0C25_16205 [Solicola gregarius]
MSDSDADERTHPEDDGRRAAIPGFGPRRDGETPAAPSADRSPRTLRNVLFVLGGVAAVVIVVIIVLILVFFTVIDDAVKDVESKRNETAITTEQFQSVKIGAREETVRDEFGEPEEESTGDGAAGTTCLYYNEKDAGFVAGDRFMFCFVEGRLERKSRD